MEPIQSRKSFHDLLIKHGAYCLVAESDFGINVYDNPFEKKIQYYSLNFHCPNCNCTFKKIKLNQIRCFKCEILHKQKNVFSNLLKMVFNHYNKMDDSDDKDYVKVCLDQLKLFECFNKLRRKKCNKSLNNDEIMEMMPSELTLTPEYCIKLKKFFITMKNFIQNLH